MKLSPNEKELLNSILYNYEPYYTGYKDKFAEVQMDCYNPKEYRKELKALKGLQNKLMTH